MRHPLRALWLGVEKCGAAAWEALNDGKKFSNLEITDTFGKLDEATVTPLQKVLICQRETIAELAAALIQAKNTLSGLGYSTIAAEICEPVLTKAKEAGK